MSKSSRAQTDSDERKVIRELLANSNENISNIGEKYGFSRQKVWYIKKRLEKNKTIWGYVAVIDDEKLGLKKYLILLKRISKPLPREKLNIIINEKLEQEFAGPGVNVDFSCYTHGYYDFVLCTTSRDVILIKKFCEALKIVFEDYISDIQILEEIFTLKKNGFDNPNLEELIEDFSKG